MNDFHRGDTIRVSGHPGTLGKRFTVVGVSGNTVLAHDADARHRYFEIEDCILVTKAST